ncbi:MAG TPA: hypothetical protein P5081_22245 [Phycisphaerae bacterium]|nr:hypothetical protein [Phycisphaerae bacterium]HRW55602.1 hypothetical protein [Phycisphaerae bacterium]
MQQCVGAPKGRERTRADDGLENSMIDPLTNLTGILNIFYGAIVTTLEVFFGPFIAVFTPLLQIFNIA